MPHTKKKKQKTEEPKQITVREFATPAQAKAAFLKTVESHEGENPDTVSKFCYGMDFLVANVRTFGEVDVIVALKQFDIETKEIQRLLKLWVSTMERLNKIEAITTIYDTPQYIVV
jgi:hypothetical protein